MRHALLQKTLLQECFQLYSSAVKMPSCKDQRFLPYEFVHTTHREHYLFFLNVELNLGSFTPLEVYYNMCNTFTLMLQQPQHVNLLPHCQKRTKKPQLLNLLSLTWRSFRLAFCYTHRMQISLMTAQLKLQG